MKTRSFTVQVTTGTATGEAFSPVVSGLIESVQYIKPQANGFSNGVDFTITVEDTGETVWAQNDVNASTVVRPRAATHSTAGVAAVYAAGGTAVLDKIAVDRSRIKFAVAQAGNGTTGTFVLTVSEA